MGKQPGRSQGAGRTSQPTLGAQELLDAVNALAYGVTGLAEHLPELIDRLDVVSQQFAVLIAAEAESRHQTADNFVKGMLMKLGSTVFDPRRRGGGG